MKHCKRIVACMICCLLVCALMFPVPVAAESFDQTRTCELTIEFLHDGSPVAGVEFEVYRVGDLSGNGEMTLTGAFQNYPVELNVETNAEYQAAADTLWGYVQRDGLQADATQATDAEGVAKFAGLAAGVYLVIGQPCEADGGKYTCSPQLWTLPYRGNTADDWAYELKVTPKFEFVEDTVEPVTVKVLKKWDDAGNEKKRPASVKINLLCDGQVHDTVTLTADINWRYTWEDLEAGHEWTVVEEISQDYTVTVTKEGITFVVKNSYVEPSTTEPTTTPTEPSSTEPKIPQTGMLWWPVPVLLVMGFVLVLLGIVSRRRDHDEA